MHYVADLQGMYPVVKLAHPEHVSADVLALVAFPQALDLSQVVEAARELALVFLARDGKKTLHLAVCGHGT
jgi:serine/threonine-protein kinase RIO1